MPTQTAPPPKMTRADVQVVLNQTDWSAMGRTISWALQVPECHFYDGKIAAETKTICPHWTQWLSQGRRLYPKGEIGLNQYLAEVKHLAPEGFRRMDHQRLEQFLRTG